MQFIDLVQNHDYYCSDSNYYSNDAGKKWDNFQEFYKEYKDSDIDMNLIFRWDIKKRDDDDDDGLFYMEIFMIHQRKGIFAPHFIESVVEGDFKDIQTLLKPHFDKLCKIWLPISFTREWHHKIS